MWKAEPLHRHEPLPRSGCAGIAVGSKLVFFGGNACSSGENFLADTYVFDTATNVCTELQTLGDVPIPMDRHTAVEYNNEMWVFGGDRGWTLTNKLWKFNLESLRWTEVQTALAPCARRGHTAVKSGARRSMIVFGGMVMSHVPYYLYGRLITNNVSVSDTWECFLDRPVPTWERVTSNGHRPPPRRGHSCVLLEPTAENPVTRIYVFGGYCELERSPGLWYNDLWRFTPEKDEWVQVPSWGTVPSPRVGHGAVVLSSNSFLVFGGGTLDANENVLFECRENGFWRRVEPLFDTIPPSPRSYMTCIPVCGQKKLYLHGGCDNDRELSCMFSLSLDLHRHAPRSLLNFVAEMIVEKRVPYKPEEKAQTSPRKQALSKCGGRR
eukprot:RCo003504